MESRRNVGLRSNAGVPPGSFGRAPVFRKMHFKPAFPVITGLPPCSGPDTVCNIRRGERAALMGIRPVALRVQRGEIRSVLFMDFPCSAQIRRVRFVVHLRLGRRAWRHIGSVRCGCRGLSTGKPVSPVSHNAVHQQQHARHGHPTRHPEERASPTVDTCPSTEDGANRCCETRNSHHRRPEQQCGWRRMPLPMAGSTDDRLPVSLRPSLVVTCTRGAAPRSAETFDSQRQAMVSSRSRSRWQAPVVPARPYSVYRR